uniref:Uncharacterized protein n=1 Tax=Leersia perrieri TaxID=77586 RepID=A0A0D9WMX7_9ORYZ
MEKILDGAGVEGQGADGEEDGAWGVGRRRWRGRSSSTPLQARQQAAGARLSSEIPPDEPQCSVLVHPAAAQRPTTPGCNSVELKLAGLGSGTASATSTRGAKDRPGGEGVAQAGIGWRTGEDGVAGGGVVVVAGWAEEMRLRKGGRELTSHIGSTSVANKCYSESVE